MGDSGGTTPGEDTVFGFESSEPSTADTGAADSVVEEFDGEDAKVNSEDVDSAESDEAGGVEAREWHVDWGTAGHTVQARVYEDR